MDAAWRSTLVVAIIAALSAGCRAAPVGTHRPSDEVPLIPVTSFFANPAAVGDYQVSPDGRWLGWVAPVDGRLTVHVRPLEGGETRVIASHSPRSVWTFRWAADSRHVLFEQDRDGGQHQHVYAADRGRPADTPRDLTPIGAARAMIHRIPLSDPEHILVAHNARTRAGFDLVRISLRTGTTAVVAENPGDVLGWITDQGGTPHGRIRTAGEGARVVEWRTGEAWRSLLRLDLEETFDVVGIVPGGDAWVRTDHGRDRIALVRLQPTTGAQTVVFEHPVVDVDVAVASQATGAPLYAAAYPGHQEVHFFDTGLRDAFTAIRGDTRVGFLLRSQDASERWNTIDAYGDRGTSFWLVDRATGSRTLLGRSAIAQHAGSLASMQPVAFPSRDGLMLHGYLTRPTDRGTAGPMVLLVHGGPWFRDHWGYNSVVQFLANRGYAVLQVNYRGSTGYGRRFREALVGEFGKMHDDLLDGLEWAVRTGVADRRRVGIMGWSFGGYATLVGMTFTPEVFACGVDVVGVSDLVSQLETRDTYWTWHALRPYWHKYAGDPSRPEDRRRMEQQSPLYRADRAQRPILIVHGANDPNVKLPQSERMVEALRRAGKDVEYLVFAGEGHGGFDTASNVRLFETVERFLARHLGGRAAAP